MTYGKVVDGKVVEYSNKPTSTKISAIWLRPDLLKQEGWLPVDDQRPSLEPWQRLGARTETVMSTKIKWTYQIKETSLDDYKAKALKRLGQSATDMILQKAPEYKQRNAALGIYTQAKADAIVADIQTVRTEHDEKEALILAASDYAGVDAVYTGIVAFLDPSKVDENGFPIPEEVSLV